MEDRPHQLQHKERMAAGGTIAADAPRCPSDGLSTDMSKACKSFERRERQATARGKSCQISEVLEKLVSAENLISAPLL